jgi:hypothetical protein
VALRPRLSPGVPLSRDGASDLGSGTSPVKAGPPSISENGGSWRDAGWFVGGALAKDLSGSPPSSPTPSR